MNEVTPVPENGTTLVMENDDMTLSTAHVDSEPVGKGVSLSPSPSTCQKPLDSQNGKGMSPGVKSHIERDMAHRNRRNGSGKLSESESSPATSDSGSDDTPKRQQEGRRGGGASSMEFVLNVSHLTRNTNEEHLREIFSEYGTVKTIELPIDKMSGLPKGNVYVELSSREEAECARRCLNGGQIDGQYVKMDFLLLPTPKVDSAKRDSRNGELYERGDHRYQQRYRRGGGAQNSMYNGRYQMSRDRQYDMPFGRDKGPLRRSSRSPMNNRARRGYPQMLPSRNDSKRFSDGNAAYRNRGRRSSRSGSSNRDKGNVSRDHTTTRSPKRLQSLDRPRQRSSSNRNKRWSSRSPRPLNRGGGHLGKPTGRRFDSPAHSGRVGIDSRRRDRSSSINNTINPASSNCRFDRKNRNYEPSKRLRRDSPRRSPPRRRSPERDALNYDANRKRRDLHRSPRHRGNSLSGQRVGRGPSRSPYRRRRSPYKSNASHFKARSRASSSSRSRSWSKSLSKSRSKSSVSSSATSKSPRSRSASSSSRRSRASPRRK